MQEILLNYEGIIGAIAGAVLATVATLITTHVLRNFGKVEVSIFDVKFEVHESEMPYRPFSSLDLRFNVKLYNTSESIKVLDNIEVVFLDGNNKEIYSTSPDDLDTFKPSQFGGSIDRLFFVNLPPKQLTMKRAKVRFDEEVVADLKSIKIVKLMYNDKRKKNKLILKR